MTELVFQIEKVEQGRIRVVVLDNDAGDLNGNPYKAWEVETADEWTTAAIRQALQVTGTFLTKYLSKTMRD